MDTATSAAASPYFQDVERNVNAMNAAATRATTKMKGISAVNITNPNSAPLRMCEGKAAIIALLR
jgi:hypothetical protein